MRKPTVIMISGFARVGKDTLAKLLLERVGGKRLAFADELKNAANHLLERFDLHGRVDLRREDDKVRHRHMLVAIGKWLRSIDKDVFARPVAQQAGWLVNSQRCAIISDWRYVNEYDAVVARCAPHEVIRVELRRQGVGPANEEEAEHQDAIQSLGLDHGANLADGDLDGLARLADQIAADIPKYYAA